MPRPSNMQRKASFAVTAALTRCQLAAPTSPQCSHSSPATSRGVPHQYKGFVRLSLHPSLLQYQRGDLPIPSFILIFPLLLFPSTTDHFPSPTSPQRLIHAPINRGPGLPSITAPLDPQAAWPHICIPICCPKKSPGAPAGPPTTRKRSHGALPAPICIHRGHGRGRGG